MPPSRRSAYVPVRATLLAVLALATAGASPAWAADNDTEYGNASDAKAESVANEHFDSILDDGSSTGPDLKPDQKIIKYQSDTTAIVSDGDDRAILQSTLPMRATDDEDGKTRPVSLDLEDHAGFVSPENPLADIRIGDELGDGVSFPDIGVSIRPLGMDTSTPAEISDGRAFFANSNASADLDYIVNPTITGAETYDVLRSEDSPERLRYAVTLPDGAQLIAHPEGIAGGLQVVRDGKVLLTIAPVAAFDADRKPVTATYELTDEGFAIDIPHRQAAAKYPILVDPSLWLDQRYFDTNTGIYYKGWGYSQLGSWHNLAYYYQANGKRAMQVWNPANYWIGRHFWGRFTFAVPGDAWISNAYLGHYAFLSNNSGQACTQAGLMRNGAWVGPVNASNSGFFHNCSGFPSVDMGFSHQAGWARPNQFIAHWASPTDTYFTQSHLVYVGGAAMVIQDDNPPTAPTVTGLPASGTWTATKPTAATLTAADGGVGIQRYSATRSGATATERAICSGTDTTNPYSPSLWCPMNPPATSVPIDVPEGESTWTFKTHDLVSNTSTATGHTIKLDTMPPTLGTPAGNLWDAREQDDHRAEGHYTGLGTVTIPAGDSGSGVREVLVLRDGTQWGAPATYDSDSQKYKWTEPAGSQVSDGRYKIEVVVRDNVWASGSSTAPSHERKSDPFHVTIDRVGNVHTSSVLDSSSAPSSAELQGAPKEHSIEGSVRTRREDGTEITTRSSRPCQEAPSEDGQCAEARSLLTDSDDLSDVRSYAAIVRSHDVDDSRVDTGSETGDLRHRVDGLTPDAGDIPIADALQDWQRPPSGRSSYADRYTITTPATIDGEVSTITETIWVDRSTELPLRYKQTAGGTTEADTYFTYEPDRRPESSMSSDFFALEAPLGAETEISDLPSHTPSADDSPSSPPLTLADAIAIRVSMGLNTLEQFVESTLSNASLKIDDFGIPVTDAEWSELRLREKLALDTATIADAYRDSADFGGLWIDQAGGGRIKVALRPGANKTALESAIRAAFSVPDRIDFVDAPFSAAALRAKQGEVVADEAVMAAQGAQINVAYIDYEAGRVQIDVQSDDPTVHDLVRARFGDMVSVQQGDSPTDQSRRVFSPTGSERRRVPGGLEVVGEGNDSQGTYRQAVCTSGFSMRGTGARSNEWSVLTAGHCYINRNQRWTRNRGTSNPVPLGRSLRSADGVFAGDPLDYRMDAMQIKTRPYRVSSRVLVHPGQDLPYRAPRYQQIKGAAPNVASQPQGQQVCAAGMTFPDARCGELIGVDAATRRDGELVTGFAVARQPLVTPATIAGDSGAPVYRGATALGVLQGGTSRRFTYTPISYAMDRFRARVVTARTVP